MKLELRLTEMQPEASEDIALWLADEFTQVYSSIARHGVASTELMIAARQH
jgi:hypothetical protein